MSLKFLGPIDPLLFDVIDVLMIIGLLKLHSLLLTLISDGHWVITSVIGLPRFALPTRTAPSTDA